MLNRILSWFWIKHPRLQEPDTMLTVAVLSVVVCWIKFLFNDVSFTIAGHTFNCGHVDALAYGALLGPTLGAYTAKKWAPKKDGEAEHAD